MIYLELPELAQATGQALIDAMVGDAWTEVRTYVVRLFGRHAPGREQEMAAKLDGTRSLLINGDVTQRASAAALWQGRFEALLTDSPDAAGELSGLVESLRKQHAGSVRQHLQFADSPITARRGDITISQTGVDNRRTFNTENTFVRYVKSNKIAVFAIAVIMAMAVTLTIIVATKGGASGSSGSTTPDRSTPVGAAEIFIAAVNARDEGAVKAISCEQRMVIDIADVKPKAKAELNSGPVEDGEFTVIRFLIFIPEANGQRNVQRDDQIHLRNVNGEWCVNDL